VPDLLSDFLLEGACLTAGGESTGFADVIFEHFHPTYLSNILRNFGELDWRITQRNQDQTIRLLDQIWAEIEASFEGADAGGRVQLFKSLKEAALFQPVRVMGLIRRAMATEAVTTELLADWKVTQESVLREIPPLLRATALHLAHFEEAVAILWDLAQRDSRTPNQYPEHARRVLEDLAEYGRYKPVVLNDRMADLATRLSQNERVFDGAFTPLEIADKLLVKEGQFTESEGFTVSFGGFALNYPVVKPVREKAIVLVESCLNSGKAKVALRALDSLSQILSGFLPAVVRQASPEELAWQDAERERALKIIEDRLRREAPIPIVRQIRSMLRRARPRIRENPLGQHINAIIASTPESDDLLIFDAFSTAEWGLDAEHETLEDAARARTELIARGVRIFREKYPRARQQVEALIRLVNDAQSCGMNLGNEPYSFIDALCSDPEFLNEFLAYALNEPHPLLAQMICIPLRHLRTSDPNRYRDAGILGANHKDAYVGYGTANAISYGPSLTAPLPEDVPILEALSQHPNLRVRHLTFTGIRRLGAHAAYERPAIDLLLRSDVGDDPKMAEEMCGAVHYAGINLARLSDADIQGLLQKLVATKEIDDHDIEYFLNWVGQNHPAALCEFIISRLDQYAGMENRGEPTRGYTPVPHHRFGGAFRALQGSPKYGGFLIQVRDRFITQPGQGYWLRELYWEIGTVDATTLGALDELLHSGDREKARAAIDLLGGAPPQLALTRPAFAIHMIGECDRLDHDLAERAASTLISNAHTGPFNRVPGQPSPKYLAMKERSAALKDSFAVDSTGRRFFARLYDSALAMLERERIDDEEQQFQ
jgi:hypothetical protein